MFLSDQKNIFWSTYKVEATFIALNVLNSSNESALTEFQQITPNPQQSYVRNVQEVGVHVIVFHCYVVITIKILLIIIIIFL